MLSTRELQAHLAKLSYKPGWTFRIYDGRHEGQHCVITTQVEDTFNPGQQVTLDVHSCLPPMRDTAQLEEWLCWRLSRIETHECREFLKRGGSVIFDPHAEYAERDLS